MKNLTEWIEQKISDENVNYFDYNEFKSSKERKGLIKEHGEIGVVVLKILRNDSNLFESDDETFAVKV